MIPGDLRLRLRGGRFATAQDEWLEELVAVCHPTRDPRPLLWLLTHPTMVAYDLAGHPAGYASVAYTVSVTILYDSGVAPHARRHGLMRALMAERIRLGMLFGCASIIGGTHLSNPSPRRMLAEAGFEAHPDPQDPTAIIPYAAVTSSPTLLAWMAEQYKPEGGNPWLLRD